MLLFETDFLLFNLRLKEDQRYCISGLLSVLGSAAGIHFLSEVNCFKKDYLSGFIAF
jgi:hypothetical protein